MVAIQGSEMKENERERIKITRQIQKFIASGGKIDKVSHTQNKGYRDSMKKTKTYAPGGMM